MLDSNIQIISSGYGHVSPSGMRGVNTAAGDLAFNGPLKPEAAASTIGFYKRGGGSAVAECRGKKQICPCNSRAGRSSVETNNCIGGPTRAFLFHPDQSWR